MEKQTIQHPQENKITKIETCIGGIYKIRNLINDKIYIGSAKNIKKRWKRHITGLKHNKYESPLLQRAWNKYGPDNFVFEIIKTIKFVDMLIPNEQIYLDLYKSYKPENGYNICPTAGSPLGRIASRETREKLSKIGKIRESIPENKAKRIKAMIGNKLSIDTIEKIRQKAIGRKYTNRKPISQEVREKLRITLKEIMNRPETKKRISDANKGQVPWNTGKHLTEDHKKKLSTAGMGNKNSVGHNKHPLSEETKRKIGKAIIALHNNS